MAVKSTPRCVSSEKKWECSHPFSSCSTGAASYGTVLKLFHATYIRTYQVKDLPRFYASIYKNLFRWVWFYGKVPTFLSKIDKYENTNKIAQ